MPRMVMINVGSLEYPTWVKLGMQMYCDSARSWVQLGGGLHYFPKMPTRS
jgi:hypothetical protein